MIKYNTKKLIINFPVVFRVMGWLLMIEGAFMVVPLLVSLLYSEYSVAESFALSTLITGGSGVLMAFCIHPKDVKMQKRDGLFFTAIVWLVFSLFGMMPFLFTESLPTLGDAFFETMSGFSTTGATVFTDVESLSHGILIWRALIQWIGGMGIILFTIAVLPMLNRESGVQLFNAEVTGLAHDKLRPRIGQTAKSLWATYIGISIAMFLLLWIGPMNMFDALCHTMSGVSTGGFSTRNASIAAWGSRYVNVVVIVFMFLGGVNFSLIYYAWKRKWKPIFDNEVFKAYLLLELIASLLIFGFLMYHSHMDDWVDTLIFSVFETVSATTSTGYGLGNFECFGSFMPTILMLIMVFGACAGSTTGGAKLDRLVLLFKLLKHEIYHMLHMNSIRSVRVSGNVVDRDMIIKIMAFLAAYMMILALTLIVLVSVGLPEFDAFFTGLSALSNIGLGFGVTGSSFAPLPEFVKIYLSLVMMVGRLEIFTVLIIFTKSFWTK